MKLKLLLALMLLTTTLLAKSQAILQLDTFGHTGTIGDIIVTKSGDIISASYDKTIRVWDSKTGREKRKILGQIGSGAEGMIFAIALSGDERYLAVGGFMGSYTGNKAREDEYAHQIRIYNYHTGKLLQVLKSHTNVVFDLAFSRDGNYLISGSGDTTAKIWEKREGRFQLEDTIDTHSNDVYGVDIIQKGSHSYAVTVGYDNKISLYDMERHQELSTQTVPYKLQYVAHNQNSIAVAGKAKEIKIYDYHLHLIKTIENKTKPAGVKYSPNGRYLIAGTASYPYNVNIYNTKDYTLVSSFKKHTNLTQAVNFLDNQTAVSGGGDNEEIYIWDRKTTKVKKKIVGVGSRVWSVGIKGDTIAWGNSWTGDSHTIGSKLQKSINLKNYQINGTSTLVGDKARMNSSFRRISTKNGNYSLQHKKGGEYGKSDASLDIIKDTPNGRVVEATITKDATDGYSHRCYGWYRDMIVSGGSGGHLKVYSREGKELASLVGHTGEIWSIALDGDRLVSGSDDQTIRVWDLSQIGTSTSVEAKIYPMLNIFVSKNNDYVVWSKSGYFTSSVGGDKYVGYHINQGANKEARYVSSDKYFDTLYRPDIISYIWQTGSEKKAIAYASRTRKVRHVDVANALPPEVHLFSPSRLTTSKRSIEIKYSVESKEPITKTIITINGKKLSKRGLQRKKSNGNTKVVTVALEDGENIISIRAKNRDAMSDEVLVYASKRSITKHIFKPTLYLLSIGVSRYKNAEFNLKYADKDALSIAKMFQKQKGKIYKKVVAKTLVNGDATSDNILDALDWIDKEVTSKDVAIIFIAGHGLNDERGNYYFLSSNVNLDHLRRTAVKWYDIQDTISDLPSKVILLADTCHSGNITGGRRDITSAIKSIINSGSGSVIMTATTGRGYSYEQSDWGHGAFTKAILEGIGQDKADYDYGDGKDGMVTIKELDNYITYRVKKLTNGKQKPTTIIPDSVPDFAIGVK